MTVIEGALAAEASLTRDELGERVASAGLRTEGQALVHLLFRACAGLAVRGPMKGRQHAYVLVRDWLGEPRPVDRDAALAELARRFLAGHGPADDRDLAKWTGAARRARGASTGSAESALSDADGLVDLAGRPPVTELPAPKLLAASSRSCSWLALPGSSESGRTRTPVISGGIFRPAVLVDGRVVGTWTLRGDELTITRSADRRRRRRRARDRVRGGAALANPRALDERHEAGQPAPRRPVAHLVVTSPAVQSRRAPRWSSWCRGRSRGLPCRRALALGLGE